MEPLDEFIELGIKVVIKGLDVRSRLEYNTSDVPHT